VSVLVSIFAPAVVARSSEMRHSIRLSAAADIGRYQDFSAEDYDDWRVAADARLDGSPASGLLLGGAFASLHQPRDSPDDAGGLTPTRYTSTTAFADFSHRPGRLFLNPVFVFDRLEYQSVPALVDGELVEIEQNDRDRNEYTASVEGGRRAGPEGRAFLRTRVLVRRYDRLQQLTGFDRSSEGFEVGGGLALGSPGVTRLRAYVGYREQRYEDPLPDIREPVFDVSVEWRPSEITTLELGSSRDLAETTAPAYSGYVSTTTRVTVDHELLRSLLLDASLLYVHDDYVGIAGARRIDRSYGASVGMSWTLSRGVVVSARYEASARRTSDDTFPRAASFFDDFDRNVAWVRVEVRR
jgi:hypothetical protein